jgi:hypothetical protein
MNTLKWTIHNGRWVLCPNGVPEHFTYAEIRPIASKEFSVSFELTLGGGSYVQGASVIVYDNFEAAKKVAEEKFYHML